DVARSLRAGHGARGPRGRRPPRRRLSLPGARRLPLGVRRFPATAALGPVQPSGTPGRSAPRPTPRVIPIVRLPRRRSFMSSSFRIRVALAVLAGVIWLTAAGTGAAQAKSNSKSTAKSASTKPAAASTAPAVPAWVAKSNQNAQALLDVMGKFAPE